MFLKIHINMHANHANHHATGQTTKRKISPFYIHTPTRTHQQGLSKAAWWVSRGPRSHMKHTYLIKQCLSLFFFIFLIFFCFFCCFCFFFLFFFPSSALSAALLLAYLEPTQEQTRWKLHCASCLLVFRGCVVLPVLMMKWVITNKHPIISRF